MPDWLKNTNFWLPACVLFMISCGEGPPDTLPEVKRQFRTTPPSRIYFKNIRSTAYQWEQDPQSRTDYFLLRKIGDQDPKPLLYPLIADIWMEDQAWLILKSGAYEPIPTPVRVFWEKNEDSGVYQLDSLDADNMYSVGLSIYQSLRRGDKLEISFPGRDKVPLFDKAEDKNNYLISVQDYLRLTDFY
jgi:hypothetical protein